MKIIQDSHYIKENKNRNVIEKGRFGIRILSPPFIISLSVWIADQEFTRQRQHRLALPSFKNVFFLNLSSHANSS